MRDIVHLHPGRVADTGDARIAVTFLRRPVGAPPDRADLCILPRNGVEQHVRVAEGQRFPIGAHTWVVESIEDAEDGDVVVRVARVAGPGMAG